MKRPRVFVNVAASADGKIDSFQRRGTLISSATDKARVDKLRADVDAIIVGGNTLLAEDPKLTIKSPELRSKRLREGLPENPAKIGIVTKIPFSPKEISTIGTETTSTEKNAGLLKNFISAGNAKKYIFTTQNTPKGVADQLKAAGVVVHSDDLERVNLRDLFQSLLRYGIRSVLVEGGGTLIGELIKLDLVDEITIYIAPRILGGASSPTMADGEGFLPENSPKLQLLSCEKLDSEGGVLLHYVVKKPTIL